MKKMFSIILVSILIISSQYGFAEEDSSWGYKKELLEEVKRNKYASDEIVDYVAEELDIDFNKVDRKEFARGMIIELEHGKENPATDVTGDDPILTAKIVLAHLNKLPEYYTLLDELEENEIHGDYEYEDIKNPIALLIHRMGPVFMASLAFHMVILFIISLISANRDNVKDKITVITDIIEIEEEEPPPEIEEIVIEETEIVVDKTETE